MSVVYQSFSPIITLNNIPQVPDATALSRDAFQVVGTPTETQIVATATYKGQSFKVVVDGSFQYPLGLPKTGGDFSTVTAVLTQQTLYFNNVVGSRTSFTPSVDGKLQKNADTQIAAAQVVFGGNDTFIGALNPTKNDGVDTVDGFGGNDIFYGNGSGKSDDIFYGGSGTDTSVYRGKLSNYTITAGAVWNDYTKQSDLQGFTVTDKTGLDGRQQLNGVERLQFTDGTLALDFNRGDNGYKAAMLIGAAFGKDKVSAFFSPGIQLFDSGMTTDAVAALITDLKLVENTIGSTSNKAFVDAVYKNVMGVVPDALSEALYTRYLDTGAMSKTQLLTLAAGLSALENQINLTGLQTSGVLYSVFI
jgi:hypothetical protein